MNKNKGSFRFEVNLKVKADYSIEDLPAWDEWPAQREILLRYDLEGLEDQIKKQVKQAILDQGLLLPVDDIGGSASLISFPNSASQNLK